MPHSRPVLLSLIISPFAELNPHIIRIILVFISSTTTIFVYFLSKTIFHSSKSLRIISSIIWALYPPAIWYSGLILTEALTSLLLIITALTLIKLIYTHKSFPAIYVGISLGLLILTRSSYVFLPFALVSFSILSPYVFKKPLFTLNQCLLFIFTACIVTSPIIIRNYSSVQSFLPTETRLAYGLIMSNGDFKSTSIRQGGYDKNTEAMKKYSELQQQGVSFSDLNKAAKSITIEQLRTNYNLLPEILMHRTINFWGPRPDPFDSEFTNNDIIMVIIWAPILLMFLFSFLWLRSIEFWLIIGILAYVYLTSMIFWCSPRFRFPIDSFIIILSVYSSNKLFLFLLPYFKYKQLTTND